MSKLDELETLLGEIGLDPGWAYGLCEHMGSVWGCKVITVIERLPALIAIARAAQGFFADDNLDTSGAQMRLWDAVRALEDGGT